jgi:hypothetical protein
VKSQGFPRGAGLGTADWGKVGGDSNGISPAQRGEIYRCCAHVAYETTPRVVGLVEVEMGTKTWWLSSCSPHCLNNCCGNLHLPTSLYTALAYNAS